MKFGAGHGGPNGAANGPFGQPPSALNQNAQSQPSTQQLRMLVQQIQMAVQHGYLNHQILNQPLAPQTLLLLNQMLNHIKVRIIVCSRYMTIHVVLNDQSSIYLVIVHYCLLIPTSSAVECRLLYTILYCGNF